MKRSREYPCDVCDHYHLPQHVCGVCGHCSPQAAAALQQQQEEGGEGRIQGPSPSTSSPAWSAGGGGGGGGGGGEIRVGPWPSEILADARPATQSHPGWGSAGQAQGHGGEHGPVGLYLGGYDHAARPEVMRALGIKAVVNAVGPRCTNLYRNSFAYFTCTPTPGGDTGKDTLDLGETCRLIDAALRAAAERIHGPPPAGGTPNVLVHCMSGVSRGPAAVIAFLMLRHGMGHEEATGHVIARHPATKVSRQLTQELAQFEAHLRSGPMPWA